MILGLGRVSTHQITFHLRTVALDPLYAEFNRKYAASHPPLDPFSPIRRLPSMDFFHRVNCTKLGEDQ